MVGGSDKENINVDMDIDMPKKRTKTVPGSSAAASAVRGGRATSRKVIDPSKVLSPKSHNSRQLPQPPLKAPYSPGKSYLARPVSPVKLGSSIATATASVASTAGPAEASRRAPRTLTTQGQHTTTASAAPTGTLRGKRGAAATAAAAGPPVPPKQGRSRAISNSSDNSNTSAGTTIVTKKNGPAKKGLMGKMTGMANAAGKRATSKREIPAPSAGGTGGRVLRARK
jgi:hypothetical protein